MPLNSIEYPMWLKQCHKPPMTNGKFTPPTWWWLRDGADGPPPRDPPSEPPAPPSAPAPWAAPHRRADTRPASAGRAAAHPPAKNYQNWPGKYRKIKETCRISQENVGTSSIKCRFMAGKSIEQKGGSTSVSPVDCSLSPCKQCPALWVLVNHQAAIQQKFLGFSPIYDQKTSEVWTAEHVNNNTRGNPWKIPTSHDIHGFPIKKTSSWTLKARDKHMGNPMEIPEKTGPTSLGHWRSQRWSSTTPQESPRAQGQARQEVMMEGGRLKLGIYIYISIIYII